MEKDFLKVIETRRSCRKYKPEQITDEELKAVLEAGTYAPTSRGMQSPYIVAVQKKEVLAQLAKMNAEIMGVTSNPYYDAPTYVLVFCAFTGQQSGTGRKLRAGKHDAGSACAGIGQLLDSPGTRDVCYRRRQAADGRVGTSRRTDGYRSPFFGLSRRRTCSGKTA